MDTLNTISNVGRWSSISNSINANFETIEAELEKLGLSAYKGKGYFISTESLRTAFPNPSVGDWAIVSGIIYYCSTAGTWNQGVEFTVDVDLTDYVEKNGGDASRLQIEDVKLLTVGKILPFDGIVTETVSFTTSAYPTGIDYKVVYLPSENAFVGYRDGVCTYIFGSYGVEPIRLNQYYNNYDSGSWSAIEDNLYISTDGRIYRIINGTLTLLNTISSLYVSDEEEITV